MYIVNVNWREVLQAARIDTPSRPEPETPNLAYLKPRNNRAYREFDSSPQFRYGGTHLTLELAFLNWSRGTAASRGFNVTTYVIDTCLDTRFSKYILNYLTHAFDASTHHY